MEIRRLRKQIMQSRDRLRNLERLERNLRILRMHNAISRLRKYPDCAEQIQKFMMYHFEGLVAMKTIPFCCCLHWSKVVQSGTMQDVVTTITKCVF